MKPLRRLPIPKAPAAYRALPLDVTNALQLAFSEKADELDPDRLQEVLDWADRLRLLPRVLSRRPALLDRLDSSRAEGLRRQRRSVVASGLVRIEGSERLRRLVDDAGLSMVFLKGAALLRQGYVQIEARASSDIDILTGIGDAPRVQDLLIASGFEEYATLRWKVGHQHLRPISSDWCGAVEVHRWLPGVGVTGDYSELTSAGWIGSIDGEDQLTSTGLALHAIAHQLYQERWTPWNASLGPTLGDLIDLGCGTSSPVRSADLRAGLPRIPGSSIDELLELVEILRDGDVPTTPHGPGEILLSTIAALQSDRYRRTLRRWAFLEAIVNLDLRKAWRGLRKASWGV